jgi:hypothetical protein
MIMLMVKGKTLAKMLWWGAIHDGQHYATSLDYGFLSSYVVKKAINALYSPVRSSSGERDC